MRQKEADRDTENKPMVTDREGGAQYMWIHKGCWVLDRLKHVLYNKDNIAILCKSCKWQVTFKLV